MGMHIGATWQMRLSRPCAAVMWRFCQITFIAFCAGGKSLQDGTGVQCVAFCSVVVAAANVAARRC